MCLVLYSYFTNCVCLFCNYYEYSIYFIFLQMPSTPPYKCLTLQRLVLLTSDCFPGNTRHSLPYVCDTQLVENSLIVFGGKITSGQSRLVLIVLTLRRARAHPLDSSVLVKALCKNKIRNVRGRSIIGIFVLFTEYTSFKSKLIYCI